MIDTLLETGVYMYKSQDQVSILVVVQEHILYDESHNRFFNILKTHNQYHILYIETVGYFNISKIILLSFIEYELGIIND